jgi:sulfide:quinone oxidoreductase
MFRRLLAEADAGALRRLVFAVPTGCSWPLPLYELALQAATSARARDTPTEITIVTPEREPLAAFGTRASILVRELLGDLDVRFLGGTPTNGVRRDGALGLAFDAPIKADRVVAVPRLTGQRITGVPASWWGFLPTDSFGQVEGLAEVYAAGDMTTFPVKQGALAAQQADRVAQAIAEGLGSCTSEPRAPRILMARLLGGERTLCLRTELDDFGQPTAATIEHVETQHADRSAKVFGRYLTPYLECRRPLMPSPLAAA